MGIVTHLTDLTDRVRHGEEAMGKSSTGYHCHNPIISYDICHAYACTSVCIYIETERGRLLELLRTMESNRVVWRLNSNSC